jgi:hypothetical protein
MSNRELKLKMWQNDPRCHWCRKPTQLLNIPEIKGPAPEDLATLDHLTSRLNLERWIKKDKTKVLSCYKCNADRAIKETKLLSKEELRKRGQGFSLNPRGKPIITGGLNSLDDVKRVMREKLPDFDWYEKNVMK